MQTMAVIRAAIEVQKEHPDWTVEPEIMILSLIHISAMDAKAGQNIRFIYRMTQYTRYNTYMVHRLARCTPSCPHTYP